MDVKIFGFFSNIQITHITRKREKKKRRKQNKNETFYLFLVVLKHFICVNMPMKQRYISFIGFFHHRNFSVLQKLNYGLKCVA